MSPAPSSLNQILRGESTTGILHTILGDPTFSTILWLRQFAWCRDDIVGSEINAWDKPPFDLKKWERLDLQFRYPQSAGRTVHHFPDAGRSHAGHAELLVC